MRRRKPTDPRPRGRSSLDDAHRRLRRAFAAILVAVAPASLMQACGEASPPGPATGVDAGHDAAREAHADVEGDVAADTTLDAVDDGDGGGVDCGPSIAELDGAADATPICSYSLPCGLPDTLSIVGCGVYNGEFPLGCNLGPETGCGEDVYVPTPGAAITLYCPGCLGGSGRRPRGLVRAGAICAPTPAGAYFAAMAHDEAASVHAFARMRDELAAHGAPQALLRAASRAIRDEVRHARVMAGHARMRGAPVPAPRVRRSAARSLEAIARENTVEGCVNETFGALIAAFQAAHAPSASLRRVFARVAEDEARHAALAWAAAAWAEARLGAAARARVAAARARALGALRRQAGPSPFDAAVGRPSPAVRARLLDGMIRALDLAAATA